MSHGSDTYHVNVPKLINLKCNMGLSLLFLLKTQGWDQPTPLVWIPLPKPPSGSPDSAQALFYRAAFLCGLGDVTEGMGGTLSSGRPLGRGEGPGGSG